jgi:hypothetical protein
MDHTIFGLLPLSWIYGALLAVAIGTALYSRRNHKVASEVFSGCYLAFLPLVSFLALGRLFIIDVGPTSIGSALSALVVVIIGVVLATLIPAVVIYGVLSRMSRGRRNGENAV